MLLPLPSSLKQLLDTSVAVLGGGVSGQAVFDLVQACGGEAVIYDEQPRSGCLAVFGAAEAAGHKLLVYSPGFRPEHQWLRVAAQAGCVCLCELDFASLFWRGRVLAVTGTNGKTTLVEFLTHALKHAGKVAFSTGNIGHSFSRLVLEQAGGEAEQIAVCEVSSFQAEMLWHFQAEALLWTNFAEDHLERHEGLYAYFSAKLGAAECCRRGSVFVGASVAAYAQVLGFLLPDAVVFPTLGLGADKALDGTVFADYPQRENFELAAAWWLVQGLELAVLRAAAKTFKIGPHRLSLVSEVGRVQWWNDSKATNFHAVEAALLRFPRPVILIAGGKDKGGNHEAFIERIAPCVRRVFLIGETKEVLAQACRLYAVDHKVCRSFEEALSGAALTAEPGEQVLLSPGFASFDMFRGYEDRGSVFEQWVHTHKALMAGL